MNTILRRKSDGKLLGYNTDCIGSISAIEDGLRSKFYVHSIKSFVGEIKVLLMLTFPSFFFAFVKAQVVVHLLRH